MSLDPSSDTFDALIDQFLPGKYDPPVFALRLAQGRFARQCAWPRARRAHAHVQSHARRDDGSARISQDVMKREPVSRWRAPECSMF